MRLLYDDEIFIRQRFGGVSRVFSELIRHLRYRDDVDLLFNCAYSENEYLTRLFPDIPSFLRGRDFPFKGKLLRGIYGSYSHQRTNNTLLNGKIDVFHPTFYTGYYLQALKASQAKLVFTVHDLIHEKTKGNSHYERIADIKQANLKVADQVIVVSEHTRKDLLQVYPFVNEEKVHVIHLAGSLPEKGVKPAGLPDRYILFTGERSGYKNFETLLLSFARVSPRFSGLHLFCAGSRPFDESERKLIGTLGLDPLVKHARLSEEELRYAYCHAEVFVYPSLYEGFGIPLLEAFSSGVPVVSSRAASLPEVGGDAALFVDAASEQDLADAISRVLEDTHLRKTLVDAGLARTGRFSWKKHADLTLEVYRKALE